MSTRVVNHGSAVPSLVIKVFGQATPNHSPRARAPALGVMDLERVVTFIPVAEFFSAPKAGNAVSVIPTGTEEEACLGKGVRVCLEVRGVRPFDGGR